MYTNTYLYVLVDVTDDALINNASNWEDDGVEIYIDIDNTKIGCCGYGANVTQSTFIATAGNIASTGGPNGSIYAKQNRAGGYVMEMRFTWTSLKAGFVPTPGANLGFDVSINDDDDNGTRDNQLVWNAPAGSDEWQNASRFGTLPFSSCNPLPVTFISFTGKMVNGQVHLNWTTTAEINNDKFIVERSCDAETWEAIGEVDGIGNTNALVNYSYKDNSYSCDAIYYRLKQVDINGFYAYSTIVAIQTSGQKQISVSPNPFQDVLTIHTNVAESLDITILDVLGRAIYSFSKEAVDGEIAIQPELASGAYVLILSNGSIIEQRKIIKN